MFITTKILENKNSKFNGHLKVVRTLGLGTYIQADGLTQSGGIIKSIWGKTLGRIKREENKVGSVLILGLGGGTVVELIKKYWPKAKIIGVDIDPLMVELGEKYLGLSRKDIEVMIGDASDFVGGKCDLVLVDLYNGYNFPKKFEEAKFLKKLTKNKLVVFNRLYFGDERPKAVKFGLKLQKMFKQVEYFYPEANLMLFCRPS